MTFIRRVGKLLVDSRRSSLVYVVSLRSAASLKHVVQRMRHHVHNVVKYGCDTIAGSSAFTAARSVSATTAGYVIPGRRDVITRARRYRPTVFVHKVTMER